MAWRNRFQEIANSKPLFLAIYATVITGIVLCCFYVYSTAYFSGSFSNLFTSSRWRPQISSPSYVEFSPLGLVPNSSQRTAVGIVLAPAPLQQSKLTRPIWEVPPSNLKMPPLETFQLTKKLVQQRVKDNIIIVTFGNYAFMDFILTWVKHLTDIGLDNLLIGAMDTKLLKALYWKGIPVFDMGSHMTTTDAGWGSKTFQKIGREKIILLDAILQYGYELLMCDTDTVWFKNPLPYIARFPEADVLTSTDQLVPTVADDRLENWQQGVLAFEKPVNEILLAFWTVNQAYNIGIFHWRPTNSTKRFTKEWKEILVDEMIWDQTAFNNLLRKQLGPSVDEDSGLVYAYDGNLKLGLLPASIFCSGHTYFVQKMYQQLRLEPYVVHATFQYAGTEGKRHRLREAMAYYDPPEYYDSPGGFLTFKPCIPKSLLLDGEHNIESHFSLINYQIKQIRTALAISSLLNRKLVMPPLWCRLDRLWYPHPGVLIGTMTRQPFLCPLDHVFKVDAMLMELPEEEYGAGIDIREYSFFDNPSVSRQVKESWLDVQLCQEGSRNCRVSNATSPLRMLKFPKHRNEETFKAVFTSFKDVKVIQFSTMQDAFLGFTDKTREERFRNRMKQYLDAWCCVENHIPGHIYYDMYWDEKPGWKPIPPETPEDDHPPQ